MLCLIHRWWPGTLVDCKPMSSEFKQILGWFCDFGSWNQCSQIYGYWPNIVMGLALKSMGTDLVLQGWAQLRSTSLPRSTRMVLVPMLLEQIWMLAWLHQWAGLNLVSLGICRHSFLPGTELTICVQSTPFMSASLRQRQDLCDFKTSLCS